MPPFCTTTNIVSNTDENIKDSCDPKHALIRVICHEYRPVLAMVNLYTKFEMPTFTRSKDRKNTQNLQTGTVRHEVVRITRGYRDHTLTSYSTSTSVLTTCMFLSHSVSAIQKIAGRKLQILASKLKVTLLQRHRLHAAIAP